MWTMKRVLLLLMFITWTSMAAGCMSTTDDPAHIQKDELILALGAEPETGFDPTTGWGRYGSPLFQSTLLKRDVDLNIINDLATGYDISEDGLIWTVQLREGVKFSDGEPLTAEDVVFTFQTAAEQGSTIDLTVMERVEAIDAHTVQFTLRQAQSTFVQHLLSIGIVPKHAYGPDYAEDPIGSGPYRFVQWDRGQQLIVEANPEYYGQQPYFRKLTFLFLGEDAAFAAAKSGDADVVAIPSAFSRQEVAGMRLEAVRSVDNRGIMFPYVAPGEVQVEDREVGNLVTSDLAIRQAINIIIDRQALVEGILDGYGTPAYSANDHLPWWNAETVFSDADVSKAKEILTSSGWIDQDGDGIVEKDGTSASFTLLYPAGDVTRQSLALAVADMVKQVGIEMIVEGKNWEEIKREMSSSAVVFGWGSHDPLEMYYLYNSRFQGVDYYNPGYYSNETVDHWMQQALAAKTETEALPYWKLAQWDSKTGLSALGDAPWAWLVNLDHLYLVREDLDIGTQRIQPHSHGWPITDNIVEWTWHDETDET